MYDLVSDELKSKASEMGFEKYLSEKDVKVKQGGGLELNRKIIRTKGMQVLLDPVSFKKEFDTAVAQVAKDKGVSIAFSLNSVLKLKGIQQVLYLRNMKEAVKICLKKKNNIIICSNAMKENELKDANLLVGFALFLGMSLPQAKWSINQAYEGLIWFFLKNKFMCSIFIYVKDVKKWSHSRLY